ncbi:amino acid oxidase [Achaetomium macrosporum]|uniref:Amino acid oxidase n=1 Tax=Achaetomium macrosporum TaxID=79813 RepID=A0AAN7HDP5_9PEZI|nr:amino acid oxidase [Achaetomium macrosporum]
MSQHVAVVGAGVIGLSSALLLQRSGYAVTIIARDFPGPFETMDPTTKINYTSPWGGAHNRWVPPHPSLPASLEREHAMSLRTFDHMKSLHASHPHTAGITFLQGIEYIESPGPEYLALSTPSNPNALNLPGFRLLDASELPADGKVTWGCEYDTWCVNPMVYCSFLLRRFVHRGGRVLQRELRRPEEAFSLLASEGEPGRKIAAVVNASGTGLVPDPAMTITRGQTCLVAEECDATVTRQNADGSWTFCVPRGFEGGTIIGGTKELNNWDAKPSMEVRARLLKRFAETYPKILGGKSEMTVIRDIVGRRPTRDGGPRVEGELVSGAGFVMHAYGLGGRGYELSWGVAEAVVEGVERHIKGAESKL